MAECRIARNASRSIPPSAALLPLLGSPVVHPCGEQAAGDGGTHHENDLGRCHRLTLQLELLDDEVCPEVFAGFGLDDRGHLEAAHRERNDRSGRQSGRLDTNMPRSKPSRASVSR
jgi:hypothetical protein